jgi:hypothetical protein
MYSGDIYSFMNDYNLNRSMNSALYDEVDELKRKNVRLTKLVTQYKLKNYLAVIGIAITVTTGAILLLI